MYSYHAICGGVVSFSSKHTFSVLFTITMDRRKAESTGDKGSASDGDSSTFDPGGLTIARIKK
jgi:hypothetical protein